MKVLCCLAGILCVVVLQGCVSWTHPSVKGLDEKSYSVIYIEDIRFSIKEFDGKGIGFEKITTVDNLKLPAGEHTLSVLYDQINISTSAITKRIKLEPGHKYKMVGEIDAQSRLWTFHLIKDADSSHADLH